MIAPTAKEIQESILNVNIKNSCNAILAITSEEEYWNKKDWFKIEHRIDIIECLKRKLLIGVIKHENKVKLLVSFF